MPPSYTLRHWHSAKERQSIWHCERRCDALRSGPALPFHNAAAIGFAPPASIPNALRLSLPAQQRSRPGKPQRKRICARRHSQHTRESHARCAKRLGHWLSRSLSQQRALGF